MPDGKCETLIWDNRDGRDIRVLPNKSTISTFFRYSIFSKNGISIYNTFFTGFGYTVIRNSSFVIVSTPTVDLKLTVIVWFAVTLVNV